MTEPEDTRRDIGWIRYLWRTAKRPVDAITKWAKKPRRKEKIHRFRSAAKWAATMQQNAKTAASRAKFKALRYRWKAKYEWIEAHPPEPADQDGLTWFDGKQVPTWIVEQVLIPARASGLWRGSLISGFRTPEYCRQLCRDICGRDSCPGICAGASSNHACPPDGVPEEYKGAVDVNDPAGLQRWCRNHGNPLRGNGEMLPRDLPHFSRSGR